MNNELIINNDEDLNYGLKSWFCQFILEPMDFVYIELKLISETKLERVSANGFNNLLTMICALKQRKPDIKILVQLFPNNMVEKINDNNLSDLMKKNIKRMLIFFESLNLVDMLLNLDVIVRPSNEILQNMVIKLDAKKEERKKVYSSKILCLSPLIDNSQEQYNLTYRMKTLINILYWQLNGRIGINEIEEASGQIMFELVKNIYQHANIKNNIAGFACAQINPSPLIRFSNREDEDMYTESTFLALTQLENNRMILNAKNKGAFISITVNDFGIGIHNKVKQNKEEENISTVEAILKAFSTTFSSKSSEFDEDYWKVDNNEVGIKLEHKGYGLIYCLMFVYKNLGRIRICTGDIELKLFTQIDSWAKELKCDTPVDFLNLINQNRKGYLEFFDMETRELKEGEFAGTQILIEIPTNNMYKGH